MNQTTNWHESAARLIETQENAAKAAQTAYNQLARVNMQVNPEWFLLSGLLALEWLDYK